MIVLIWVMSCVFISGFLFGRGYEKKRSDRKLAAIVAERLLRKPEVPSSANQQPWTPTMQQQLAAMGNSNPMVASGHQGMFNSLLGAAGSSHGFSGGSQLQQAITYAKDDPE